MTRRVIGPPLDAMKEAAKAAIVEHFASLAHVRPVSLQAMDAVKTTHASIVLGGGSSSLLAREAGLRGMPVEDLAQTIVDKAAEAERAELARMTLNLAIEAAPDHATVARLLAGQGIALPTFGA